MVTSYVAIIFAIEYEQNYILVVALLALLASYNASQGPLKYVHMYETCVDSAVGMFNLIL